MLCVVAGASMVGDEAKVSIVNKYLEIEIYTEMHSNQYIMIIIAK
jgi:hypothetical protein